MKKTTDKMGTLIHFRMFGWHLYLSKNRMCKRIKRTCGDGTKWKRDVIIPLKRRSNMKCEICGCKSEHLQAHHILPYSRFADYRDDLNNFLFICGDCHNEIHRNPFINAKLIREECERRGLDYRDFYNTL